MAAFKTFEEINVWQNARVLVKDIYEVKDLDEAVDTASFLANEDDVVLFSPACKSDKEDETYIERGNLFKATVKHLENEHCQ